MYFTDTRVNKNGVLNTETNATFLASVRYSRANDDLKGLCLEHSSSRSQVHPRIKKKLRVILQNVDSVDSPPYPQNTGCGGLRINQGEQMDETVRRKKFPHEKDEDMRKWMM